MKLGWQPRANGLMAPAWSWASPMRGRDRLRWLVRRWVFALVGFAAGLALVAGLHADAIDTLWRDEDPVQSLQQQLAKLQDQVRKVQKQLDVSQAPPNALAGLPAPDREALIWLQLSRLLEQHAVQLKSLRPVPERVAAPLTSQAVAVHLHAHFDDWVAVWAALNARAPVWSIDRLRITPQAEGVSIEAVLRVWFSDGLTPPEAELGAAQGQESHLLGKVSVQAERATRNALARSAVFVLPPRLGLVASPAPEHVSENPAQEWSANPGQWPLDRVRLLGVWHQAQGPQAILAAGPHWVRARVGQQIGPHGFRVVSIHAREVHLRSGSGSVVVLGFEKVLP